MIISESHEFIFVHNYKVAGESIREALREHSSHPLEVLSTFRCQLIKFGILNDPLDKHLKARQIRRIFPNKWDEYFTFGFVRNPWSWHVSLYFYMLQKKDHKDHEEVKSMDGFEEFIESRAPTKESGEFQSEFFCNEEGDVIVDYVGRLEEIESDFRKICKELDLEAELPHKNKSNHEKYKKYYNKKTKNIISEVYNKDIEKFGYEFDGIRDSSPIVSH